MKAAMRLRTVNAAPAAAFNLNTLSVPLLFHYDAKAQTATNGATVTTLVDQSGNGNDGTKGGSGNITYATSGINGFPAWNIPAGAYTDTPTFASIATTVPIVAFAVIQLSAVGGADKTILASTAAFTLGFGVTGTSWFINRGGANISAGTADLNPHRVRGVFAPSSAASTSQVFVDGASVVGPGSGGTTAQTRLRAFATSSGFGNFGGKCGKLFAFRGAPSGPEIAAIEANLAAEWGI